MSIQSEINRINSNVQAALNAVADTGVSVPEGANSDNLPVAVSALANEKQDKLTGTKGQIVGFDADGIPEAQNKPSYSASEVGAIPSTEKGAASGVATLGADGKVPSAQLPSLDYVPTSEKGAASGVATLGTDGKVPSAQLPSMNYAPLSHSQNDTIHVTAEEKAMWNAKGNAIIYAGSYTGTGVFGSSNPTEITVPESSGITKIKFIYIYQDNYWTMLSLNQTYAATYYRSGDNVSLIAYQIKSTMSGRTVAFFHSNSATKQLNESGKTYNFFVFGE